MPDIIMTTSMESSSKMSTRPGFRRARRRHSRRPKNSAILFVQGSGHNPAAEAVGGDARPNPGLPPSSAPGAHEELLRVQGQRAIGLIKASEVWERLRRRDTSKATLSFGSRSTGQQIRVLDAANEEFG